MLNRASLVVVAVTVGLTASASGSGTAFDSCGNGAVSLENTVGVEAFAGVFFSTETSGVDDLRLIDAHMDHVDDGLVVDGIHAVPLRTGFIGSSRSVIEANLHPLSDFRLTNPPTWYLLIVYHAERPGPVGASDLALRYRTDGEVYELVCPGEIGVTTPTH